MSAWYTSATAMMRAPRGMVSPAVRPDSPTRPIFRRAIRRSAWRSPGTVGRLSRFSAFSMAFAQRRVGLHDFVLLGRELSRFEQNAVGDSLFADVVKRRGFVPECRRSPASAIERSRPVRQMRGQQEHVLLRTPDVMPGLGVARLGQRRQCKHCGVLDRHHFLRAPLHFTFEERLLIPRKSRRSFEREVRPDAHSTIGGLIGLAM